MHRPKQKNQNKNLQFELEPTPPTRASALLIQPPPLRYGRLCKFAPSHKRRMQTLQSEASLCSALNVKREGAVSSRKRKAKQKARAMRGPFVLAPPAGACPQTLRVCRKPFILPSALKPIAAASGFSPLQREKAKRKDHPIGWSFLLAPPAGLEPATS